MSHTQTHETPETFSEDLVKFGTGSKDERKESPVNSAGKIAVPKSNNSQAKF